MSETDNNNIVTPADVQRAKDNSIVANDIQNKADKRLEDAKKDVTQEPILVTESTKPILARQGITNVITQEELDKRDKDTDTETVVNTVKDAISKPADIENKQVSDTEVDTESKGNIDLTEQEYEALTRSGLTEDEILDSDRTIAQVKEIAQDQLKKEQVEVDKTKTQDHSSMVISDAYAEELALTYPFAKSLKGKTMEDVMKIVSKQNSYITTLENSKEVVENKTDIDKTNSQTDNSDKDLSDDEVIDFLNLSPKDAAIKLRELMKRTADAVTTDKVATEIKKLLPNLEGLQEASNEHYEKEFYGAIQKDLPEGVDAATVVKNWKEVNVNMSKVSKQSLANNVELLITRITDDYKLGKLSKENTELIKNQDNEVKAQTFKKVKELILKSKKLGVHNGQFNFKRKEVIDITGEPQGATEEMYDEIIKRNLNR